MKNSKNNSKSTPKAYKTNYAVAVNWLHNNFILCNNIANVEDFTLYENMRFTTDEDTEIYQWYLTDANEHDVEFLEQHFGLLFTYSDELDLFVLCVPHYGTSWDYVYAETDLENAKAELGEKK